MTTAATITNDQILSVLDDVGFSIAWVALGAIDDGPRCDARKRCSEAFNAKATAVALAMTGDVP